MILSNILKFVYLFFTFYNIKKVSSTSSTIDSKPNVIIILCDDLGYGDLSFEPFNESILGKIIRTPELSKMASKGMILSNFHTASPLCSPSRASIMVGLFPWRMGIDFIYAGDLKLDGSEEMDHEQLPLIPNIAMSFHDANYYTAHIGKWHLGGQNTNEIANRLNSKCIIPGINHYGFDEYVGMSEGTNSSRYITHQAKTTYTMGSNYLIKNDIPLSVPNLTEILTDRQTDEAMRVIKENNIKKKPFFLNLWYDAPHSPWQAIQPYYDDFKSKFNNDDKLRKYASMISNMDMNIGRLLNLVDTLGISNNTIILFTSDNGPENGAGSGGEFKGRKRLLTEGGIRVPCIIQWTGKIKPGSVSNKFILTTDIFPTLLNAANLILPSHIRLDGISFLPVLLNNMKDNKHGDERIVLWFVHAVGFPILSAAWSNGYKLLLTDYENRKVNKMPPKVRLFDMRRDEKENDNLAPLLVDSCNDYLSNHQDIPFTWSEIGNIKHGLISKDDTNSLIIILKLIIHLQIKSHLFRFSGSKDWLNYHKSKPYEYIPSCNIRNSSVSTFGWGNHILVPEFCGENSFGDVGGDTFCRSTDNFWDNSNLENNKYLSKNIYNGLSSFAIKGSKLENNLKQLLLLTKFNPICNIDLSTRNSFLSISNSIHHNSFTVTKNNFVSSVNNCHNNNNNNNNKNNSLPNYGWSLGHYNYKLKQHNCHLRINNINHQYKLTSSSCGYEATIFTISLQGMPFPLSLCESSLSNLNNLNHQYIDDNMMIILLYDLLYKESTNSFAVMDPLFFHLNNINGNGDEINFYNVQDFIDVLGLNVTNSSNPQLYIKNWLIIPIYVNGGWSIIVIYIGNDNKFDKSIFYYDPLLNNNKNRNKLLIKIEKIIISLLKYIRPIKFINEIINLKIITHINDNKRKDIKKGDTGLIILLFMKKIKNIIENNLDFPSTFGNSIILSEEFLTLNMIIKKNYTY